MAYTLGNFQGYPVVRINEKEYDGICQTDLKTFYVRDNGYMYFYNTPVAKIYNNSEVREFDMALVNRVKKRALEGVAKAQNERKEKVVEKKVAEARYVEEKEPVVTDTETADRILESWQGNIDGVLEKLMSKELVIKNAFN